MANSRFAYVRDFELPDSLLLGTYILVRLDGRSFHRFSEVHNFAKPNDVRALQLMDHAAKDLMEEYPDIAIAFGESDEYSFLFANSTTLYNRRQSKIVSTLTSYFTSCYVFHWAKYFPDIPLQYPPCFDGRIVLYPSSKHIKDYFAWRQTDTHINNLYNTTFWALVQQGGQTTSQAHATLRGTFSKDKHEILFSRFGINYNNIDARFRKGSVLYRQEAPLDVKEHQTNEPSSIAEAQHSIERGSNMEGKSSDVVPNTVDDAKISTDTTNPLTAKNKLRIRKREQATRTKIELLHCDIIRDEFWHQRPWILGEVH